jgi:hypothetical protein
VPSSIRQAKGKNPSEPSRRRIKRKKKRKGLKITTRERGNVIKQNINLEVAISRKKKASRTPN